MIPVRNAQTTLEAEVTRVLDVLPDLTPEFEVVIVDNASHDATPEIAEELAIRYPQLRVVRNGGGTTDQEVIENGLSRSTSDYIFVQNQQLGQTCESIRWMWENRNGLPHNLSSV